METHQHLLVHGHSAIHGLAPEAKIAATLLFAVGVAITPRTAVWAFVVDAAVIALLLAAAGYTRNRVLARLSVATPFLVVASIVPFIGGGEQVEVAWFELSRDGLWSAWSIAIKAVLGTSAGLVLTGTTPVSEIVRGLGRLRLPRVVVSIIAMMFRYLDVIVEELGRTRVAMTARGHDPRWFWQVRPIASAAGSLFVRSYERGERVHDAMVARGFAGTMPEPDGRRSSAAGWAATLSVAGLPALLAVCAIAIT